MPAPVHASIQIFEFIKRTLLRLVKLS